MRILCLVGHRMDLRRHHTTPYSYTWWTVPPHMGDMKKIYFVQFVLAQIATFCISAVPVFGILYFGTDVATQVLDALKGTPMQILTVIGQILPAMGIAIILRLLSNRPNIIQLFMLGFVLSIYGNVPMIVIAVVAFIIASLYADLKFNRAKEEV